MTTPTHPPIPPKCEMFGTLAGPKQYFIGYGILDPEKVLGTQRKIVAYTAEVEWSKRAERWNRVVFRDRWLVPANDGSQLRLFRFPKLQCYAGKQVQECRSNANAWRQWGEVK